MFNIESLVVERRRIREKIVLFFSFYKNFPAVLIEFFFNALRSNWKENTFHQWKFEATRKWNGSILIILGNSKRMKTAILLCTYIWIKLGENGMIQSELIEPKYLLNDSKLVIRILN